MSLRVMRNWHMHCLVITATSGLISFILTSNTLLSHGCKCLQTPTPSWEREDSWRVSRLRLHWPPLLFAQMSHQYLSLIVKIYLLAPQSGALRITPLRDFHPIPIPYPSHPLIAFEHLSLSMVFWNSPSRPRQINVDQGRPKQTKADQGRPRWPKVADYLVVLKWKSQADKTQVSEGNKFHFVISTAKRGS